MKYRKVLCGLLSAALIGTMLGGCGNGETEKGTEVKETQAAETEKKVQTENGTDTQANTGTEPNADNTDKSAGSDISGKLIIWEHSTDFENALDQLIEGFNVKYPDIEVEYEVKPSDQYYSLLATSIQAGEAPDIFWTNGTATAQMAEYVSQGAIMDITDEVDLGDLEESSYALATIGDKRYSVPWMTFDTRTCYYNKDIFNELGLEVPKTFSEYEKLLAALQEGGKIPISLSGMTSWPLLFFAEPMGSALEPEYTRGLADYSSKANDERFGNIMNKMLEWADKGYFGEGWLGVDDDGSSLAFTTGEAAMFVGGSWSTTSFQENNPDLNLGAFQIPSEEGTSGMVGAFANGFSAYSGTENKEAAIAFLNYCATLEAQTNWVQTLGGISGSPKIESSNDVAKEIADCDETFTSWQSNLSKYNKEGVSATSVWEEDSVKVASKAITVQELLDNLGEVMQ